MSKETVILEELEAIKMVNDFKLLLSSIDYYQDEIELHLTAKDCAIISVNKIIELHVTRDHKNKDYWLDVRNYIQII